MRACIRRKGIQARVQIDISRECIFAFLRHTRAGNVLSVKRLFSVDVTGAATPSLVLILPRRKQG